MPREPDEVDDDELRLILAPGVGPSTIARLRGALGSARAVSAASVQSLAEAAEIGQSTAARLHHAFRAASPGIEREAMRRAGVRMVVLGDVDYPALLSAVPDPPVALWVRGDALQLDRIGVAVVGSRRCSHYGRSVAGRFASVLASCGVVIVSGGARGIDATAHEAALRCNGSTVAVVGCGLGRCYPPEHAGLYGRIAEQGCVVSEFPIDTPPRPALFPRRNRVISGLSVGVLLVEAAVRSGALITARIAAEEHGREVMAVPGPIDVRTSAGCHRAIREGWAGLVTCAAEVFQQLETAGALVRGALERDALERKARLDAAVAGTRPRGDASDDGGHDESLTAGDASSGVQSIAAPATERARGADATRSPPDPRRSAALIDEDALVAASRRGLAAVEALAASWSVPIEIVLQRLTILSIRGKACRGMA